MTVHMSTGDQQNVDPEKNPAVSPSDEMMDTAQTDNSVPEPSEPQHEQSVTQPCNENVDKQGSSSQLPNVLRMRVLLRTLEVSSFNSKMSSLNELNQMITSGSSGTSPSSSSLSSFSDSQLSPEMTAQWLVENNFLDIALKDCLHQPQYVEKLENIIRFLIKSNALSLNYLDMIWNSQIEKHEIIVKNVHDLIAKMAWSFSSDQLNHLFVCFESSWANASKKEREKLLELMRRLAEDDKDGSMAHKVLTLLWDIAYSDEADLEIIDQALTAHHKILDYGRTYDKDTQKIMWLKKCIGVLAKRDSPNTVIPAMKHIREICRSFPCSTLNIHKGNKIFSKQRAKVTYRHEVIAVLQEEFSFVALITSNLSAYMEFMRNNFSKSNHHFDPRVIYSDRRFSHFFEVFDRLNFLKFILQEGQLWLCIYQANEVWNCLARNALCKEDTQVCFRWFTSLVEQNHESDLDPETFGQFFEMNILKLDPALVDVSGMECFQKFFLAVNCQKSKLVLTNKYFMNDNDLIGMDYLWKLIFSCDEEVAQKAINLLIEVSTNLGPKLIEAQVPFHIDMIHVCFDRLKASNDTIGAIENDPTQKSLITTELRKMSRVLCVLQEYINKCDNDFSQERTILPMSQSYRGKQIHAFIKVLNFGRNSEELELWTHTNESLVSIRKKILTKLKMAHNVAVDFSNMGDKIDLSPSKLVSHLQYCDKLSLTARLIHANTNICNAEYDYNEQKSNIQKLENCLPGVIISKDPKLYSFLFQLADIGMSKNYFPLQEKCLSLLKIIPPDESLVNFVKDLCQRAKTDSAAFQDAQEKLFSSPTKTIYILGIIYSLLLPTTNPLSQESQDFQLSFITSKCALQVLNYLVVDESFLAKTDNFYKICSISIIMKISKFVLATLAFLKMFSMSSSVNLNEILKMVPKDYILQKISMSTAQNIHNTGETKIDSLETFNYGTLISSIIKIAYASATGSFKYLGSESESLHQYFLSEDNNSETSLRSLLIFDSFDVCRESIEILIILFMLSPNHLKQVINEEQSQHFFIDLLLNCHENSIRLTMLEQFTLIITKCIKNEEFVNNCIKLLFKHLKTTVPKFFHQSRPFFQFFCNLLNYAFHDNIQIATLFELISYEVNLLKNARKSIRFNDEMEEIQLEGHFKIAKELVMLLSHDDKYTIGGNINDQVGFIDFLTDECLFPSSKSHLLNNGDSDTDEIDPICATSNSLVAAYELLISLCTACPENLSQVNSALETYFCNMSISDFEFYPFMGMRPPQSFVGLKNAGATCYMNSVLQQLFMIPEIRNGILSVNTGSYYSFDDNFNEDPTIFNNITEDPEDESKCYNIGLLKQMQIIFGHLLLSKSQYYVPKGFWRHFKLFGGPINLREQHDALEFFNSLVDSLDEALKSLKQTPIMSHYFGGTFADQKICKGCPHRYSREESFTTLNVDVRNHNSLTDSLEQYVKGDLLEGDNAYHCERCDRKVDTVKRLCIKKLPKILAIQLKRFDYDYERETAIKFNDYFEFPRILDMQPYTVNGLAQIEGEVIEDDLSTSQKEYTRYELNGIVVHSGQASGGHYYSFILDRNGHSPKWHKFDDGDVTEWKLDDEEIRNQCFGGDYVGEVFDQMLKRMSHRTQKRWWNAFILIYRQINTEEQADEQLTSCVTMPLAIKKNVQQENIRFLHQRNLFSEEFYYFMRRIIQCNSKFLNANVLNPEKLEKIIYTTLSLASKFLFSFCFRTKKSLRGNAIEWYEEFIPYLKTSCSVRLWFMENRLLNNPNLFSDFLLECPAADVRHTFAKIIVLLSHYALIDNVELVDDQNPSKSPIFFANQIMTILISLLKKEICDYSNQLTQFFHLFHMYAGLGVDERHHLLQFDLPYYFILIATDEGPGFPIKYQYVDLNRLFQVVSFLVRSCSTEGRSNSAYNDGRGPMPNPYKFENHNYIMPIQDKVYDVLFVKKKYLKKIIKEAASLEETCNLLKFCCWENPLFSKNALCEVLYHISNSYSYELRPYFELLNHILMLNDSWQENRIAASFEGDEQNFDGLFEILTNHTVHMEKRAYQCIKYLVYLFENCEVALMVLKRNQGVKQKWLHALAWLNESLNYATVSYQPYNSINWTAAHQGESGSYALERSNSATLVLAKAEEILSEEDFVVDSQSVGMAAGDDNDNDDDDDKDDGGDCVECVDQQLARRACPSPSNETEPEGPLSNHFSQLSIEHDDGVVVNTSCQPNEFPNVHANVNDSPN